MHFFADFNYNFFHLVNSHSTTVIDQAASVLAHTVSFEQGRRASSDYSA